MQAVEELIKEIDPDYARCYTCKRLIHTSEMDFVFNIPHSCKDILTCHNHSPLDSKPELDVALIDYPPIIRTKK